MPPDLKKVSLPLFTHPLLAGLGVTHKSENPLPDLSNTSTAMDWLSKLSEEIEEITVETKEIAPYTRIDLGDVTPHNIKLLKKVNQVVFPIVFDDKFYKDVLESGEYAKLAYYNDVVVGAVCCRVVVTSKSFSEALILASTNP